MIKTASQRSQRTMDGKPIEEFFNDAAQRQKRDNQYATYDKPEPKAPPAKRTEPLRNDMTAEETKRNNERHERQRLRTPAAEMTPEQKSVVWNKSSAGELSSKPKDSPAPQNKPMVAADGGSLGRSAPKMAERKGKPAEQIRSRIAFRRDEAVKKKQAQEAKVATSQDKERGELEKAEADAIEARMARMGGLEKSVRSVGKAADAAIDIAGKTVTGTGALMTAVRKGVPKVISDVQKSARDALLGDPKESNAEKNFRKMLADRQAENEKRSTPKNTMPIMTRTDERKLPQTPAYMPPMKTVKG